MRNWSTRIWGLLLGLALFPLPLLLPLGDLSVAARLVLGTALLMATWWVLQCLPIYATALVPLLAFPAGGVLSAAQVSPAYMDPNIVLFMGGFFMAMALQKWNLHRRLALAIIARLGGSGSRLVLGFMAATAFLSMWVSNTATAVMMLPIALAVIQELRREGLGDSSAFPSALMLGIAYSASLGGIATLIGTPPNIIFASQFAQLFPQRPQIGFGSWMLMGVPFSLSLLAFAWFYLTHLFSRLHREKIRGGLESVRRQREELGPLSVPERRVGIVFVLTALAWIFRRDLRLGGLLIPGWASWLQIEAFVHDSTVAVAAALLLFSLPSGRERGEALLDWKTARNIPWGILLLFGGGLALAKAFQESGAALWIGERLGGLQGLPLPLMILLLCLFVSFLTEFTSNTATAALLMPILAGTAQGLQIAPELLMIPAAISASCAFMLPIATPPNAIAFSSEELTVPQMMKAGFLMNLVGAAATTLVTLLFVPGLFS